MKDVVVGGVSAILVVVFVIIMVSVIHTHAYITWRLW